MKKSEKAMKMFSANIRIGKLLLTAIVLMLSLGLLMFSAAAAEDVKVSVNGSQIVFDVPPQIINGRTMVPMRAIFEALGAEVDWNSGTQTATAVKDNTVIIMQINNPTISVNGVQSTLDSPPVLVNSRTLVPVRAIAEGFGSDVQWDEKSRTVYIAAEGVAQGNNYTTGWTSDIGPGSDPYEDYEYVGEPVETGFKFGEFIIPKDSAALWLPYEHNDEALRFVIFLSHDNVNEQIRDTVAILRQRFDDATVNTINRYLNDIKGSHDLDEEYEVFYDKNRDQYIYVSGSAAGHQFETIVDEVVLSDASIGITVYKVGIKPAWLR